MSALRVRFCPSPTGLLHVGGVRTALYNWLYARRRSGVMVLRIEDTDEARENPEAIEQIQRSLRWCGLDWDEGPGVGGPHAPYMQSERRPLHLAAVETMLEDGTAYRCYCTPEELDAERKAAQAAGLPTVYSRKCRWLTPEQRAELEASGRRAAIRLAIPEDGEVAIDDIVRGQIRWENALLGDNVIVRSDGIPTYNLVNPLDDAAMGITHVIRGDDLLPSTPAPDPRLSRDRRRDPALRAPLDDPRAEPSAPLEARRGRLGRAAPRRRGTCPRPSSTTSPCSAGASTASASCSRSTSSRGSSRSSA